MSIAAFNENLQSALNKRSEAGLLRSLSVMPEHAIDFCSNDYLGFARLPFTNNSMPYNGATGSRLISGNHIATEQLETTIAEYHHAQAALLFNSGYAANTGLLGCIAGRHDTFLIDELSHASIHDGVRLSYAASFKFKHNDLQDLEQKMKLVTGQCFVVTESLFSMDGDKAPLTEIAELCRQYKALLIVDEAHATGVYGPEGRGLVCEHKLENAVMARIFTYGKALGVHGAAITGSHELKQFLINHARSFIYSTALPPHTVHSITTAYQHLPKAAINALNTLIAYFKTKAADIHHLNISLNDGPIQTVITGSNDAVKALAAELQKINIYAKAILSPTVPAGSERLRICLHTFNTTSEIDLLFNTFLKHKT